MKIAHNDTLSPQLKPSAAKVNHSRKEETMNTKKTILYERLSHEDGRENESVSIENQKAYLEEYATRNDFTNLVHMADDGYSGTRWDRPAFMKMMDEVERGNVGAILIKDMSRLGRDHLRVGLILEQLREMGVRLIAVAEAIDTAKGEDDFMPFRNIIAEWHARDTSRKIRAIFGARTAQGKHVTGAVPYGYLHDPQDRQKWIIDPKAAPVVKRIFQSIISGKNMTKIAEELTAEKILTQNAHWQNIGAKVSRGAYPADPYRWAVATIVVILKKEEYMGWKVLNTDSVRADKFIELVKRHTEFTEFSVALLNEFVEKIIAHEAVKIDGKREMKLDIYLNYIGKFELPELEEERAQEEETPPRTSAKKLRCEMTEEELQRARENDHRYYTRKVAAKKAAEEAARAAILQGTPYEIQPQESAERKTA